MNSAASPINEGHDFLVSPQRFVMISLLAKQSNHVLSLNRRSVHVLLACFLPSTGSVFRFFQLLQASKAVVFQLISLSFSMGQKLVVASCDAFSSNALG
ncbi:hypothetical protein V6N13_068302 [Hibiscus sabdariffa]